MVTNYTSIITTDNRLQNMGNTPPDKPNADGNLSVENPTIQQVNVAIRSNGVVAMEEHEPLFGQHIREAAGAIRRLIR